MIAEATARLWVASVNFVAATSTPSPTPKTPSADSVTPGPWGFAITFLVAVAVVFLIVDMTRRTRRVRYRAEIAAKLDAEQAEAAKKDLEENGAG